MGHSAHQLAKVNYVFRISTTVYLRRYYDSMKSYGSRGDISLAVGTLLLPEGVSRELCALDAYE